MSEPLGCCIIIRNDNHQVLLAKRKASYKAGFFGLPGGRVEANESLDECVVRELAEEVGITPISFKYLGVVREWQETKNFVDFIYLCTTWEGTPTLMEPAKAEEWTWFSLEELPKEILAGHAAGITFLKNQEHIADLP
jgi:8-oxo-dGTP diphosphatase